MQAIVGFGGSTGSIGALQTFFTHMPEDSDLAFVVVLHLSPEYESGLAGLLQRFTPMPVIQVCEPIKVAANSVYVIPPGKHLLTADGQLVLSEQPHEYGKRRRWTFFLQPG
jgi:two-component system, chemotaxis family, CheB/CheR fusion protein